MIALLGLNDSKSLVVISMFVSRQPSKVKSTFGHPIGINVTKPSQIEAVQKEDATKLAPRTMECMQFTRLRHNGSHFQFILEP